MICSQPLPPAPQASAHAKVVKDPDTELMRVFKSFDTDADGRILASKFQKLRRSTTAEAKEMVAAVDTDGDGFIIIEEFRAMLDDGESDALRMAFEEYKENGDGMITVEELCRALRRVLPDEDLTVEKCAEMIAGVDKDGDDVITFDEFKAMTATKSS
ncbi:probable calcium-binding protein CML20 [Lolium perenne]|uniref:probable calcium-binding protein CML20 n=1 Tax=Lolium perenne TaxID=4522 RepID=UPI0021F5D320|nr:probable calcium-binding protein CML20 [Lolium perenne]